MAVIGSIRKQSTFLIIIIGVALAAFVLGDFAKSSSSAPSMIIGTVDGEEITIMDFNRTAEQTIANTRQQQNKERLTPEEIFRAKNNTWNVMVSNILLDMEYNKLGLNVSQEELLELIQGNDPHPLIKQYFANPQTGLYERNLIVQYIQNFDNLPPEARQQWVEFEKYIKNDRLKTKYDKLIEKGYYVPSELARMSFEEENNKANIDFVSRRLRSVPDSTISPTDEDYQREYDVQKELLKQEPYRDIDYIVFDIVPSANDMQAATNDINAIYTDFQNTTDVARFVLLNSDKPYDSTWKAAGQLPVQTDSIMFNSEIGTVVQPYSVGTIFYTSRLADIDFRPDSLKASHILISYQGAVRANPELTRTRQEAEQLTDSLYQRVKSSSTKFSEVAMTFSDDPSAKTNNGELGWFADGMMVQTFNQAVLDNKIGTVVVSESPFGFHIIRVDDKKEPVKKVRVATVETEVIPSTETYQHIFAKASKIASENKTLDEYDVAVEDEGYVKKTAQKLRKMDNFITGLNSPRQIVLWAYKDETEQGMVSDVFELEDQFVVAALVTKAAEGYPPLEDVKSRINTPVYDKIRGKVILEDMEAKNVNFENVNEFSDYTKDAMPAVTFTEKYIKGFGTEDEIIGTLFGMNDGDTYGPVVGKGGVFYIKLNKLVKAVELSDYTTTASTMEQAWASRVEQGFPYRALESKADIDDSRNLFY